MRSLPPKAPPRTTTHHLKKPPLPKASDALPLYLTNLIFFTLFFSVAYFLLHCWREKIHTSTPLQIVTLTKISAIVSLFASFIYLIGFFGIDSVVIGKTPSYSLKARLGNCYIAALIRREAVQRVTKRSLEGLDVRRCRELPLDGFDYESILGQRCEMPIGYVPIPAEIAGPLLLNQYEYIVPMTTN